MIFAQLTGTSNGAEHVRGSIQAAKEGAVAPDAPYVGGKIYFISNAGPPALGQTPKPVVFGWGTKTGNYKQIPPKNATEKKSLMRDDGTGLPQMDSK